MSIALVRSYFVDVMEDLGYEEHQEAFNDANIANSTIDKGFHVLISSGNSLKQNHMHQEIDCEIDVKFFFKGFRETLTAIRDAYIETDSVIAESLKIKSRKSALDAGLRDVKFLNFSVDPIGDTNDNIVKVTIRFRGVVLYLINN